MTMVVQKTIHTFEQAIDEFKPDASALGGYLGTNLSRIELIQMLDAVFEHWSDWDEDEYALLLGAVQDQIKARQKGYTSKEVD